MDRDSPESLLQFMNDASSSVRAALERPLEGKNVSQETFLQKCLLPNQGASKERRRFKSHGGRRRRGRNPAPQNTSADSWPSGAAQPQALEDILGIQDPHTTEAYQDLRLTRWEDGLQWSPNLNRECSDDYVSTCGATTDWQGLLSNPEGKSKNQGEYNYSSEVQNYGADYRLGKDMYSQMSRTQFTYKQRSTPRTLDEVINMMPVGCHLPPPIPSCTTFQGTRQQDEMDAVSQKMMPLILGFSRLDQPSSSKFVKTAEPPTGNATVTLPPNQANAEYTSADLDLLSELVYDLDNTNTLDKLTTESTYQQAPKEITIEDLRTLSNECTADVFSRNQNAFPTPPAQTYERQSNNYRDWHKQNFDVAQSPRQKFTVKSQSFELSCALEDTHLGGSDTLPYPPSSNISTDAQQQRKSNAAWRGSNSKRAKSHMLMAMHESRSMPNLWNNTHKEQTTAIRHPQAGSQDAQQISEPKMTDPEWNTLNQTHPSAFHPQGNQPSATEATRSKDLSWNSTTESAVETLIARSSNPTWSGSPPMPQHNATSHNNGDIWIGKPHGRDSSTTTTKVDDKVDPTSSPGASVQTVCAFADKDRQSVNISWTNGKDSVATGPRSAVGGVNGRSTNPSATPTRTLHHRLLDTQWKSWHSGMNVNVQHKVTSPLNKWSKADGNNDDDDDDDADLNNGHQRSAHPNTSVSNSFRLPSFAYAFLKKQ